jgi:hypothetical protein
MSEDKKRSGKKISAWIPHEMYDKLVSVGYSSPTEAIISGLNLLLKESGGVQFPASGVQEGTLSDTWGTQEDSAESRELRARVEELQDHNETLKAELDKAGKREEDIKEIHRIELERTERDKEAIQNLYNNYMLQMQTLINQKAIEAPGAKKPWWQFW